MGDRLIEAWRHRLRRVPDVQSTQPGEAVADLAVLFRWFARRRA